MLELEWVLFIGLVVGAICRTLYDYLFKAMENPEMVFDKKYMATMLLSIVITVLTVIPAYILIYPEIPAELSTVSQFVAFLSALSVGFTTSHLVNKPTAYLAAKKTK